MTSPGEQVLFGGERVGEFRDDVLEDIREMAGELDEESPEHIPEAMFVAGALGRHDFSIPTLHFDRVFATQMEHEDTTFREIHVPMVGSPDNLHLSRPGSAAAESAADPLRYAVVDGDLCLYIELDAVEGEIVEDATWALLDQVQRDYRTITTELESLREEAEATAKKLYREQTSSGLL